jgi:hypothetical protein
MRSIRFRASHFRAAYLLELAGYVDEDWQSHIPLLLPIARDVVSGYAKQPESTELNEL